MQVNQSLCVCYSEELGAVSRRKCLEPQPPVYFLRLYIINRFGDACSPVFLEQQAQGRAVCGSVLSLVLALTPHWAGRSLQGSCSPPQSTVSPVGDGRGAAAGSRCLSVRAGCLSRQAVLQDRPEQDSAGAGAPGRAVGPGSAEPGRCTAAGTCMAAIPNRIPLRRRASFPLRHVPPSVYTGSREEVWWGSRCRLQVKLGGQ